MKNKNGLQKVRSLLRGLQVPETREGIKKKLKHKEKKR